MVAVNFAGVPQEGYRLAFPHAGAWDETLNTDAAIYGGSGVGNLGKIEVGALLPQGLRGLGFRAAPTAGRRVLQPAAQ